MLIFRSALACAVVALLVPCGVSQFETGTSGQELILSWAEVDLLEKLVTNYPTQPVVETAYHPGKYQLRLNDYVYSPPDRQTEYTQNVIFDPCRGLAYNCCNMTFGTPEWDRIVEDPSSPDYAQRKSVYSDGTLVMEGASRLPASTLVMDETCTGDAEPPGRVDCVMARIARGASLAYPTCWNWNTSVVADAGCRSPFDGSPIPLCVELGYSQTVHIVQCGGAFHTDEHCGTFLEVHRPARSDKLADVRLPRVESSGYRMTVIPTTYKGDDTRVLCWDPLHKGAYEIWWVLRTRYNFIVERRVPFAVISPLCDWDPLLNHFHAYATVGVAKRLVDFSSAHFDPSIRVFTQPLQWATLVKADGTPIARDTVMIDPFAKATRLFTQPRSQGASPSKPGVGMGGTYHAITPNSYDQVGTNAQGGLSRYTPDLSHTSFKVEYWGNNYTYSFNPKIPAYSVNTGTLGPTDEAQDKLVKTIAARGYSRRAENDQSASVDDLIKATETWAAARTEGALADGLDLNRTPTSGWK